MCSQVGPTCKFKGAINSTTTKKPSDLIKQNNSGGCPVIRTIWSRCQLKLSTRYSEIFSAKKFIDGGLKSSTKTKTSEIIQRICNSAWRGHSFTLGVHLKIRILFNSFQEFVFLVNEQLNLSQSFTNMKTLLGVVVELGRSSLLLPF